MQQRPLLRIEPILQRGSCGSSVSVPTPPGSSPSRNASAQITASTPPAAPGVAGYSPWSSCTACGTAEQGGDGGIFGRIVCSASPCRRIDVIDILWLQAGAGQRLRHRHARPSPADADWTCDRHPLLSPMPLNRMAPACGSATRSSSTNAAPSPARCRRAAHRTVCTGWRYQLRRAEAVQRGQAQRIDRRRRPPLRRSGQAGSCRCAVANTLALDEQAVETTVAGPSICR